MLIFGAIGYLMVLVHWPRPPLILGLVLGNLAERYFGVIYQRYGFEWLLRPGVIIIMVLIVAALAWPIYQDRKRKRTGAANEVKHEVGV
jgi:TctA family transporter